MLYEAANKSSASELDFSNGEHEPVNNALRKNVRSGFRVLCDLRSVQLVHAINRKFVLVHTATDKVLSEFIPLDPRL